MEPKLAISLHSLFRLRLTQNKMVITTSTSTIFFSIFFIIYISSALADEVVSLTPANFISQVGQKRHALVQFYSPGCQYCKRFAPEFERVAVGFKKEDSVLIGKVDCDLHKRICDKYEARGLPTVRWFLKGSLKATEYVGRPTAEALIDFVNNQAGTKAKVPTIPPSVVVLSADNFDRIVLDKTKDVMVEFHAPWCSHCQTLAPTYEKVASAFKLEEGVVIASLDGDKYKEVAEKYGVSGFPTLKFFPKNNKAGEDFSGGRDVIDFVDFINEKCGTCRDAIGKLTAKAGKVESLDNLVKEFVSASGDEKKLIYSMMKEEVEKLKDPVGRYGKIYLKAAKSSLEKGPDFAKNEVQRISRMLSQTISETKADEFTLKKNILSAFA